MWNPYDRGVPVWRELECSRDEHGTAQARAEFTPWSARERLAYEDRSAIEAFGRDADDRPSARMGRLKLIGLELTLTGAEGFPPVTLQDEQGRPVVAEFNPRLEAHLLALSPDVVGELIRHALDVQPLPTGKDAMAGVPDEDLEDAGDESDPTRTPSTPQEA